MKRTTELDRSLLLASRCLLSDTLKTAVGSVAGRPGHSSRSMTWKFMVYRSVVVATQKEEPGNVKI